jgi:hypothetical protein
MRFVAVLICANVDIDLSVSESCNNPKYSMKGLNRLNPSLAYRAHIMCAFAITVGLLFVFSNRNRSVEDMCAHLSQDIVLAVFYHLDARLA